MKTLLLLMITSLCAYSVRSEELDAVNSMLTKYKIKSERPKSCPLESKKFADLVAKTEAIKDAFKSNCLQEDSKMTEILASVKDIQDQLKSKNIVEDTGVFGLITGSDSSSSTTSSTSSSSTSTATNNSAVSALSGVKFSSLFTNVTSMLKKNKCNLEDGRVLESIADLIYDSTQLGLLSGSEVGLTVAGGGFVISSAMRLIDMIFKQKFEFTKDKDRVSFIKLNCTFYDIRKDLEAQGVLEVENSGNREDLKNVKDLVEKMTASIKLIDKEKADQKKVLDSMDQETLTALVGDVSQFKKELLKTKAILSVSLASTNETPGETQKLLMINNLVQEYDALVTQLNNYRQLKISTIPMLDDLFLTELKKYDPLDLTTLNQTFSESKDFNDNSRAKLLFHVSRILNDISAKEEIASTKNQEAKKSKVEELQKRQETYNAKLLELQNLKDRLERIVSPKEYSAADDGSDNALTLLENYKVISDEIYGEWGNKFLKYSAQKSFDEVKLFNGKVERFNKKYEEQIKNMNVDNDPMTYICQDIQRLRLSYKYADSLVQAGYDFIVTNKDLFNTDGKNYYNSQLDEEDRNGTSNIEEIQRHYKSTILALKKLKNESIDPKDEEKYLSRTTFGKSYIGLSMLNVSDIRSKARNIQEKYERLNCAKVLVNDLN